jgi:hypothetical protein
MVSMTPSTCAAAGAGPSPFPRPPRTPAMLSAALHAGDQRTDVFLRDVSAGGAMVEGRNLPAPDSAILLVREPLRLAGIVVWQRGNRAGLRFADAVPLSEILELAKLVPAHQARIDEIQRLLRAGGAADGVIVVEAPLSIAAADPRQGFDLAVGLVEAVGDVLTADADVISRHGTTLQKLDELAQLLRQMERRMAELLRA